jgi:diguanylate cyclase (GGDEF)-like protein
VKIRYRITLFATIGAILIALGAFAALAPIQVSATSMRELHFEAALLTERLTSGAQEAGRLGQTHVVTGRPEDLLTFQVAAARFERDLAAYEQSARYRDDGNEAAGGLLDLVATSWTDVRSKVQGRAAGLTGAMGRLATALTDLAEHERRGAESASAALSASVTRAQSIVLLVAALVIMGIIAAAALAAHYVARPIVEIDAAARRVADGELELPIPHLGNDEIGSLSVSLEAIRVGLRQTVASLNDRIEEQTASEEQTALANWELTTLLEISRRASEDTAATIEMDGLLQADLSWDEAYTVIASYGRRLFTGFQGAIYLRAEESHSLERVLGWGDAEPLVETLQSEQCWSLKTGHTHWVRHQDAELPTCGHLHASGECSVCTPLVAHGDTLGTLVLRSTGGVESCVAEGSYEHARATLASFSGRVALAISNMQLRETLRQQALRDPLTGLHNRRIMEEGLAREIARAGRESIPLVVGFVDIDHFKDFNDTYGHEAGDYALKQVAGYLRDHTRAGDLVSRYGGEEFVTVWLGADLATAFARAEGFRQAVEALRLDLKGESLGVVTLSIGLAVLGEHGDSAESLLSAADAALYEAKGDGRNRVVVAQISARALERQALAVVASELVEASVSP